MTATLENGDSMQQTVNYVPNVTNAEITLAASKDPVIADNNNVQAVFVRKVLAVRSETL
ncbi:adhesin [Escherichia coli]|nr:adhesin [Escherichia coli]EKC9465586.1 adhesin [Escherichia albertii]ELD8823623.1 adhesin [Escherichia coli]ELT9653695.1 adhesin [Escherichia coli]